MPGNKNVGRNATANAGLCLQSKAQIDCNEFGLLQANLKFTLANAEWPALDPDQGTPLNSLIAGDPQTLAVFNAYGTYIGKQTSRFTRNGQAPGIGVLEMVCQGAQLPTASPGAQIISIDLTSHGLAYTSAPTVNLSGGGQISPATIVTRLSLSTVPITAAGAGYSVGDILTLVGGNCERNAQVVVDSVTAGAINQVRIYDQGQYGSIPSNPVSLAGGTGSGATLSPTWLVGYIIVIDGGLYTASPSATLSGGGYTQAATLGAVRMANRNGGPLQITKPWKPISTSRDTAQFSIYGRTTSHFAVKYATANADTGVSFYYTGVDGITVLKSAYQQAPFPTLNIDGRVPSIGDLILIKDAAGQWRNGIYQVVSTGTTEPWVLARAQGFRFATNYRTTLYVDVQSGDANHNTVWNCSTNITTLATSDVGSPPGDNVIFVSSTVTSTLTELNRVTIDYHAIDLHFEYVANKRLQQPQFIAASYPMDSDGFVIIDTATGDKMFLEIDSIYTETAITDPTTGNVTYKPASIPVSRTQWLAAVHFLGTGSRFEQTPAGQYWHVLETTSIKIVPVNLTP